MRLTILIMHLLMIYVAASKQQHVWSTRCNNCWTCHQTIL